MFRGSQMKYKSVVPSTVEISIETHQNFKLQKTTIEQIRKIVRNKGAMPSLLPLLLAACGGGGGKPPPPPPPPPAPDYTESPTGTFTGRDNANLTLSQGSATTDLTVNSKDGNDTITTGSGNDTIDGGAGSDTITAGSGSDLITSDIANFNGDTLTDFNIEDEIQINGIESYNLVPADFILSNNVISLTQAAVDRTGLNNFSINISGTTETTILVATTYSAQSITFTINTPPSFNQSDVILVESLPNSTNNLVLPEPTDADGDELTLTILELPTYTQIQHADGRLLAIGDTLTFEEYQNLTITTAENYTGVAGTLHVQVSDGAGGQDDLFVSFVSSFTPSQTLAFQELPTLPEVITGLSPELVNDTTYTIEQDEVFSNPEGPIDIHGYDIIINNAGVLWREATSSSWSHTITVDYLDILNNTGSIINNNGSGAVWVSGWIDFTNSGLISANATSSTFGAYIHSIDYGFTNSGTIQAISTDGDAAGVTATYISSAVVNSGNILVQGFTDAIAVSLSYYYLGGQNASFSNSGVIIAESTNPDIESVGISYGEEFFYPQTFDNAGFISADIAFQAEQVFSEPYSGNEIINNEGEVWGDIRPGLGNDTVNNSGLIVGDIFFGDGDDIYNGATGIFSGTIYGEAGNDVLTGGAFNETLIGGEGNDILTGGAGADMFVFDGTWGNDTVTDFEDGIDLLDFSASSLTFNDLTITQNGSDTLVEDGLGNSIILTGITSTDITADDFIF